MHRLLIPNIANTARGVSMERFAPILQHVADLPKERIYRTIYDEQLRVVVPGVEPIIPEELEHFQRVDFSGKSVLDLGCNFGFFSFQARRQGARHVLGVDRDDHALQGARILQNIFELDDIDFEPADFDARPNPLQGRFFDLAMLVEFIGKGYTRSGNVPRLLAFVETLSEKELLLSVRRDYKLEEELGLDEDAARALYPAEYVRDGLLLIMDYVRDFYAPRWGVQIISPPHEGHDKARKYLRFYR